MWLILISFKNVISCCSVLWEFHSRIIKWYVEISLMSTVFWNTVPFLLMVKYYQCQSIFLAPARVFLEKVKNYTGYNSCERCVIHGEYEDRVVLHERSRIWNILCWNVCIWPHASGVFRSCWRITSFWIEGPMKFLVFGVWASKICMGYHQIFLT